MTEAPLRTKLLAGAGLVCVSSSVGILYKISQAASGGFKYSTTSAIAIAELIKFFMSASFHLGDASHHVKGRSRHVTAIDAVKTQLDTSSVGHIWILSFLYTLNNQLTFYVFTIADPGTVFLFKSASTSISAVIQIFFVGKVFTQDQWKAMGLQSCGMIITQYDPCKGTGMLSNWAYILMAVSVTITAITATRNEFMIKNYKIGLNVQNMVLYLGGFFMNTASFMLLPNPNSSNPNHGFFEGYDFLALLVVTSNATIGLAVTAVYKYADAVTKCFATDVTAVILLILSTFFFGLKSSLTMWCGVCVVVYAVHSYIDATGRASPPAQASPSTKKDIEMPNASDSPNDEERGSLVGKAQGDSDDDGPL